MYLWGSVVGYKSACVRGVRVWWRYFRVHLEMGEGFQGSFLWSVGRWGRSRSPYIGKVGGDTQANE